MASILDQIVEGTRRRVAAAKGITDLRQLEAKATDHHPRGFKKSLQRPHGQVAVIAEIKQASPSKGLIRGAMHVPSIAQEYESAGAAALSVLTEEEHFRGSLANLRAASAATRLPCLRKDFMVDEFQLLEARANCADAVLLIAAILDDRELSGFSRKANELGLDVLCEVHDERELERAVGAGCDIIGVNSRNLRTFEVSLDTAEHLATMIPDSALKVAESGIHSGADIMRLRAAGYDAFLIGESLMKQPSPGDALKALLVEAETSRSAAKM
jgi:indole-3-glycerol phosphate synthase